MNSTIQALNIQLHKTTSEQMPYIITYYRSPESESTDPTSEQAFEIIQSLLKNQNLSLNDVSIFYYNHYQNLLSKVFKWNFDFYNNQFLGESLEVMPLESLDEAVKSVHLAFIKSIDEMKDKNNMDIKGVL